MGHDVCVELEELLEGPDNQRPKRHPFCVWRAAESSAKREEGHQTSLLQEFLDIEYAMNSLHKSWRKQCSPSRDMYISRPAADGPYRCYRREVQSRHLKSHVTSLLPLTLLGQPISFSSQPTTKTSPICCSPRTSHLHRLSSIPLFFSIVSLSRLNALPPDTAHVSPSTFGARSTSTTATDHRPGWSVGARVLGGGMAMGRVRRSRHRHRKGPNKWTPTDWICERHSL